MCLYVSKKSKVKTLKRACLGWKLVKKRDNNDFWESPMQTYYGQYNKCCTAKRYVTYVSQEFIDDIEIKESFDRKRQMSEYTVNEGFHSYRTLLVALSWLDRKRESLRPCIIPKGTRYINGNTLERASKEIIVCRTLKDAFRILRNQYRIKKLVCWNKLTEEQKNDLMYHISHQDKE